MRHLSRSSDVSPVPAGNVLGLRAHPRAKELARHVSDGVLRWSHRGLSVLGVLEATCRKDRRSNDWLLGYR